MQRNVMAVAAGMFLLAACSPDAATPQPTLGSSSTTVVASTATPPTASTVPTTTAGDATAEPRWIEIEGNGFIDTRTGEPFVPIGVNLLLKLGGGGGDKLFANYDPAWVDEQLASVAALDMNTVRFFLDMCMQCTTSDDGLRETYLDNLADLLTRIKAHGLVALPTSNDVPDPGFSDRLPCCEPFGGYRNSLYLSEEGHQVAVDYWTQLIEGIQERGAPTNHLLGWQLANEQFILRDVPPISLATGVATAADGATYDLSDDDAVEAMVINNLRQYVDTVGDAIRRVDEGALITMGFFSAEEPGAGRSANDNRWVVPDQILQESTLDFVDLHAYPGLGGTWAAIGAAYGLTGVSPTYPVILGEFGAFEEAYATADAGAAAMARWQAGSCPLGFGGWLLWFWGADADDEVIPANVSNAAIGRAISPIVRPDPCDPAPYESDNLALERVVSVSAEENAEYGAAKLVDGSDATWWSAAAGPPQWAEIDLGENRTVGSVEILIGHVSPPGPQTHRVWIRSASDPEPGTPVGEASGDAAQGDWLTIRFEPVDGVRFVRVETVTVDGWVILHEIRVLEG